MSKDQGQFDFSCHDLFNQTHTLNTLILNLRLMRHFLKPILQELFYIYCFEVDDKTRCKEILSLSVRWCSASGWGCEGLWGETGGSLQRSVGDRVWWWLDTDRHTGCLQAAGLQVAHRHMHNMYFWFDCQCVYYWLLCFADCVVLMQVRGECVGRAVRGGGGSHSPGWCQVYRKRAHSNTLQPEGLVQTWLHSQPRCSHCVQPPTLQTRSAHQ